MNRPITRVRRISGAVAAALVALGAAVLLGAPAQAHGTTHHIQIKQYMYMPMSLKIEEGDTVTWTNQDTVEHNVAVTSGPASFTSPMLAKGKSWSHTFTVAGPYSYICSVHPDMKATITVAAEPVTAPRTTAPAAPATSASAPAKAAAPKASKSAGAGGAGSGAAAAPAVEAATTTVSAPASSATLQPLILVVGAAVVAMVFCLLLMASRPVVAPVPDESAPTDSRPGRRRLDES